MITEHSIKAALRSAPTSGKKTVELKDDGQRGEGRLALIIRVAPGRLTAEWYAVWYRGEKRFMTKMGAYPSLALTDARKLFRADYAPIIARGENPAGPRVRAVRKAGDTFGDLCLAYVNSLAGRPAYKTAYGCLIGPLPKTHGRPPKKRFKSAVDDIGAAKKVSDVTTQDVVNHLRNIHDRGSLVQAEGVRAFIHAAFKWAIQGANSYHTDGAANWGVTVNPVTNIGRNIEAYRKGQRNLSARELRHFWQWLSCEDVNSVAGSILQLLMATGQRPAEILCLTSDPAVMEAFAKRKIRLGVYDPVEKLLYWPWTKNGSSHSIPLEDHALAILDGLALSREGIYFSKHRPDGAPMIPAILRNLVNRYLRLNPGVPKFTPRDLRRTWKTLSGRAGISKEWRDRLQNHALGDVSSKHYDRYDYLPERRAAVKTWGAYLKRILAGEIDNPVEDFPIAGAASR